MHNMDLLFLFLIYITSAVCTSITTREQDLDVFSMTSADSESHESPDVETPALPESPNLQETKSILQLEKDMSKLYDAIVELDSELMKEEEAIISEGGWNFKDLQGMKYALLKNILEAQQTSVTLFNKIHANLMDLKNMWINGPTRDDLASVGRKEWRSKLDLEIEEASEQLKGAQSFVKFAFSPAQKLYHQRNKLISVLESRKKEIDDGARMVYINWLKANGDVQHYQYRADQAHDTYLQAYKAYTEFVKDIAKANGAARNGWMIRYFKRKSDNARIYWEAMQDEAVKTNLRAEHYAELARGMYYELNEAHKTYDEVERRLDLWDRFWRHDYYRLPRHPPELPKPHRFGFLGHFYP